MIAQDGPMTCWATVYTMMVSWRTNFQMDIRSAVGKVNPKYALLYDAGLRSSANPRGLPANETAPFLRAANLNYEPMKNAIVSEWHNLLQTYGLIWVGTMNAIGPNAGRHSRIIEGINGGGNHNDTFFSIIDPDGGRRYQESFMTFIQKYEDASPDPSEEYFQIRHF